MVSGVARIGAKSGVENMITCNILHKNECLPTSAFFLRASSARAAASSLSLSSLSLRSSSRALCSASTRAASAAIASAVQWMELWCNASEVWCRIHSATECGSVKLGLVAAAVAVQCKQYLVHSA